MLSSASTILEGFWVFCTGLSSVIIFLGNIIFFLNYWHYNGLQSACAMTVVFGGSFFVLHFIIGGCLYFTKIIAWMNVVYAVWVFYFFMIWTGNVINDHKIATYLRATENPYVIAYFEEYSQAREEKGMNTDFDLVENYRNRMQDSWTSYSNRINPYYNNKYKVSMKKFEDWFRTHSYPQQEPSPLPYFGRDPELAEMQSNYKISKFDKYSYRSVPPFKDLDQRDNNHKAYDEAKGIGPRPYDEPYEP